MARFHDVPHDDEKWGRPGPHCTCGKPLGIYVRPGQHIHPCPVHPGVAIYGTAIYC